MMDIREIKCTVKEINRLFDSFENLMYMFDITSAFRLISSINNTIEYLYNKYHDDDTHKFHEEIYNAYSSMKNVRYHLKNYRMSQAFIHLSHSRSYMKNLFIKLEDIEVVKADINIVKEEEIFSDYLKRIMNKYNLVDRDISEIIGVSRSTINNWRHGKSEPTKIHNINYIKIRIEHFCRGDISNKVKL